MGDHSIPKGQPRRRPGSAWWGFFNARAELRAGCQHHPCGHQHIHHHHHNRHHSHHRRRPHNHHNHHHHHHHHHHHPLHSRNNLRFTRSQNVLHFGIKCSKSLRFLGIPPDPAGELMTLPQTS